MDKNRRLMSWKSWLTIFILALIMNATPVYKTLGAPFDPNGNQNMPCGDGKCSMGGNNWNMPKSENDGKNYGSDNYDWMMRGYDHRDDYDWMNRYENQKQPPRRPMMMNRFLERLDNDSQFRQRFVSRLRNDANFRRMIMNRVRQEGILGQAFASRFENDSQFRDRALDRFMSDRNFRHQILSRLERWTDNWNY